MYKAMKMNLSHSVVLLAMAFCFLLAALPGFAQGTTGKTGTTITFDGNSAKGLFSSAATTNAYRLFAFVRHVQTNVTLVSANTEGGTRKVDTTTGLFTNTANNILFTTDGKIALGIPADVTKNGVVTEKRRPVYYGIVAPKGYRIMRVVVDVDTDNATFYSNVNTNTETKSFNNTWNGITFQEVAFDSVGVQYSTSNSLTVSKGGSIFDIVKGQPTNVVYFTIDYTGSGYALLKSLKVTYSIDQPFTQQMPSEEGTDSIHTGDINLGAFKEYIIKNTSGVETDRVWGFDRYGISDTQHVPIWVKGEDAEVPTQATPEIVEIDGGQYFVAATKGDYYIEAPAKFRIIGATVNFLSQASAGVSTGEYTEVSGSDIVSGKEYLISDGTNYLTLSNGKLGNTTDQSKAAKWTFTVSEDNTSTENTEYYISCGEKYLHVTTSGRYPFYSYSLDLSTDEKQVWQYLENGSVLALSGYQDRKLTYTSSLISSGWDVGSSDYVIKFYQEEVLSSESGFTSTVYGCEGNNEPQAKTLTESIDSAKVELTGFNNDAIHFNISEIKGGKALYNVNLQLMPLDPEMQSLGVGCLDAKNEVVGKTTVTAENFVLATNESQTAYVIAPETDAEECQVAFTDAYNEQRTKWYTDGSKDNDGYSNYFLVGSDADAGENDDVKIDAGNNDFAKARVFATVAGTEKLDFTNIGKFDWTATTENPEYLKYNDFSKTDAEINSGCLTLTLKEAGGTTKQSDPTTVYVYTADQPTFNIMPSGSGTKHIDFRYYDITVQAIARMTPVVEVDNILIYNSTLKGAPHKGSSTLTRDESLDKSHKYVGITVKAKIGETIQKDGEGVLASKDIVDAIGKALKDYDNYCGFGKSDSLRGILYLDMSKLKSSDNDHLVDFNKQTADNCLYFMYPGYQAQSGSLNVITKSATGDAFEASSGIKIYDQQPFFTPFDFTTGTNTVSYERKGTHGKAKVTQMSCVLPFEIKLDENGHPYTASDTKDERITFRTITGSGTLKGSLGGNDYAYVVSAESVESGKAEANTPYHVTTDVKDGGFTFNIEGAKFVKTPDTTEGVEAILTDNGSTWRAYGTFAGATPGKDQNRFIFASEYFRKTGAQQDNEVAYVLPFRAWFDTSDSNAAKTNMFAVVTDLDDIVTGIGDARVDGGLDIHTGHGWFSVSAGKATTVRAFTTGGQMVAGGSLAQGETARYNVPQGVYIVNGMKVIVK